MAKSYIDFLDDEARTLGFVDAQHFAQSLLEHKRPNHKFNYVDSFKVINESLYTFKSVGEVVAKWPQRDFEVVIQEIRTIDDKVFFVNVGSKSGKKGAK